MSKKWLALLLAMMMVMSLAGAQAIGSPTDTCTHPSFHWVSTGMDTHTPECDVCGWQSYANGLHYHACTQDPTDMTCSLCGGEFTGDRTRHFLEEGQEYEYGYDDEAHWNVCPICHKATGDDGDWHSNENGDPAGICSVCGAPYGGYTTPAPTATPKPTKKPSSNKTSSVAAPTATPEPEQNPFEGVIELATEENEFTLYEAESREDGVIANLTSHLDEEALDGFAAWQESMNSIEALEATESYGSFVEMAKALVQALFPEKTEDEVNECLVALLQSGFDGTLETAELATLGEDVDGNVVGYLAAEGYELYLVLTDSGVELLVREA